MARVLGSRSTQFRGSFGGHEGRWLRAGDLLPVGGTAAVLHAPGLGAAPPEAALPADWAPAGIPPGITVVRVLPAAEYALFTGEAQRRFWETGWKISGQSNRAASAWPVRRWTSPAPRDALPRHRARRGAGAAPGEPIIQTADAHTAGGYPKDRHGGRAVLWRLAQAPLAAGCASCR